MPRLQGVLEEAGGGRQGEGCIVKQVREHKAVHAIEQRGARRVMRRSSGRNDAHAPKSGEPAGSRTARARPRALPALFAIPPPPANLPGSWARLPIFVTARGEQPCIRFPGVRACPERGRMRVVSACRRRPPLPCARGRPAPRPATLLTAGDSGPSPPASS